MSSFPAQNQIPLDLQRGPDLLRKEHFGALYYRRESAEFFTLPPNGARLLEAATRDSVMDLYARSPDAWGLSLGEFLKTVLIWRQQGFLDEDNRCTARIIDDDRSHGALIGPMVVNLQLTRACNLKCGHCFVDIWSKPDPNELSLAQFDQLFGELSAMGTGIVILAGGEPMLRRDFMDIVSLVGTHGLDAALCTNATLINPTNAVELLQSPLRWFSISLDGPDAATHDQLRGKGRFAHAVRGMRALVEARRAGAGDASKAIKMRVTVTGENLNTLVRFADCARDIGVDRVVMKPFRHTAEDMGHAPNALYVTRTAYNRATRDCLDQWPKDAPALEIDDGMPTGPATWTGVIPRFGCVGGTTHASVIYDGRVVACDAVHDAEDWTLHNHSFRDAWRKAPTVVSWRDLDGNESCNSTCQNGPVCKGGCRARAIGLGGSIDDPDPWSYCSDERGEAVPSSRSGHPLLPIIG